MKKIQREPLTKADFAWANWKPQDFSKALDAAITTKKNILQKVKSVPHHERTFENTIYALEKSDDAITDVGAVCDFMMNISPLKEVREAAQKALNKANAALVELGYDKELYNACLEYDKHKELLNEEDSKLLKDTLVGYKKMGFHLPEKEQKSIKKLLTEISELSSAFNVNIAKTNDYILLKENELSGLPQSFIERLSKDPKGRYMVSLDYPESGPFMDRSTIAAKRLELSKKLLQKGMPSNKKILQKMVASRQKLALLLGYKHYADYSTDDEMAKSAKAVQALVNDLLKKVAPLAKKDIELLKNAKIKETGDKKSMLESSDIAYYSNKIKEELFNLDTEEVRKYFPLPKVMEGAFRVYSKLFSVQYKERKDISTWHPDVLFYDVLEKNGAYIGTFALDLYPRDGKYKHMAVSPILGARIKEYKGSSYQPPFLSMLGNFTKPTKDAPSLIAHSEVETFFHEFGHLMHGILTEASYLSQSGLHTSVDFVEIPSQMFENWTWDEGIIKQFSSHVTTKKSLPGSMLASLLQTKKYMIAYWTLRQLLFLMLDMKIHTSLKPFDFDKAYIDLVKKYTGIVIPKGGAFASGWGHLTEYGAKYYSYMWSLVYADDVFTRFAKEGILNSKTGMELRKKILAKGSSKDEMELLKDFLGRAPNNKAFLKELGL